MRAQLFNSAGCLIDTLTGTPDEVKDAMARLWWPVLDDGDSIRIEMV